MLIGTVLSFSSRFCAVTTISVIVSWLSPLAPGLG
jgi:hypothetical protein